MKLENNWDTEPLHKSLPVGATSSTERRETTGLWCFFFFCVPLVTGVFFGCVFPKYVIFGGCFLWLIFVWWFQGVGNHNLKVDGEMLSLDISNFSFMPSTFVSMVPMFWCVGHLLILYFTPGTQMTSIFQGQPVNPKKKSLNSNQNKGHLGSRYRYIYIYIPSIPSKPP